MIVLRIVIITMMVMTMFGRAVHSAVGDIIDWPVVIESSVTMNGNDVTVATTVAMVPMKFSIDPDSRMDYSLTLKVGGAYQPSAYSPWATGSSVFSYNGGTTPANLTYRQASDLFKVRFPSMTVIRNFNSNGTGDYSGGCAGLSLESWIMNGKPPSTWAGWVYLPGNMSYKCTSIPKSAYRCTVTPSDLSIDFGAINALKLNNSIATTNFTMNCTGSVTVNFISVAGSTLTLTAGLTAAITLDNKNFGTNFTVNSGLTQHLLSAKLTSTNKVAAGDYSASTTLIINYQ